MHLIDQHDYDLLQSVKSGKKEDENQIKLGDDAQVKVNNDNFLRGEKEEKFREDAEWKKVEKRLTPIIHPDSTVKEKELTETINDIVDALPNTFREKGKSFLARLVKEEGVSIDKNNIYINDQLLTENITDVVDQMVRPRKKLIADLYPFMDFLKKINFPKTLLGNLEALSILNPKPLPFFGNVSAISKASSDSTVKKKSSSTSRRRKREDNDDETGASFSFGTPKSTLFSSQYGNGKGGKWCHF